MGNEAIKQVLTEHERKVMACLPLAMTCDDALVAVSAVVCRLAKQVAEYEKVIDKLTKTADGVSVWPGMKLYPMHPLPDIDDHGIVTIGIYDPETMEHHVHGYDDFRTGCCYSTKEAAAAARAGEGRG